MRSLRDVDDLDAEDFIAMLYAVDEVRRAERGEAPNDPEIRVNYNER